MTRWTGGSSPKASFHEAAARFTASVQWLQRYVNRWSWERSLPPAWLNRITHHQSNSCSWAAASNKSNQFYLCSQKTQITSPQDRHKKKKKKKKRRPSTSTERNGQNIFSRLFFMMIMSFTTSGAGAGHCNRASKWNLMDSWRLSVPLQSNETLFQCFFFPPSGQ